MPGIRSGLGHCVNRLKRARGEMICISMKDWMPMTCYDGEKVHCTQHPHDSSCWFVSEEFEAELKNLLFENSEIKRMTEEAK